MLHTKKDAIIYLLGALQRLLKQVTLLPAHEDFIYDRLNVLHKFVEKKGE